ncbi:MAG: membrane protein insertase YidC [Candidatus Latescibacteria bacterium]|jgi:YidC/Oxa1 family membrane protein insertase|nr:membrane protein insertase YidC [Candidatus Latescibacterota bacterium]
MDKRTILAFIIIGVIIFITPHYMRWLTGEPPEAPEVRREPADRRAQPSPLPPATAEAPTLTTAPEPPAPPEAVREEATKATATPSLPPERTFVVETDLYRATWSSRGARLVGYELKKYYDDFGMPLQLLVPAGSGLGLSLDGRDLSQVDFKLPPHQLPVYLEGPDQAEITFTAETEAGTIEKRLRFQGNRYRIDMVLSGPALTRSERYGVTWSGGLADTENSPMDYAMYTNLVTRVGGEVETWEAPDLAEETPPSGWVSWIGVRNKYFVASMIPPDGRYDLELEGRVEGEYGDEHYEAVIVGTPEKEPQAFGVYVGPVSYDLLRGQNRDLAGIERELQLDEFMDYGWAFFRPLMKPITILILRAFLSLHEIVPNYGLVIIVFSLFIKIIVFPLTHKSLEASAKMQELQPKMAALKERLKDDQQKLSQETMKLYKQEKVNPLGGCLPMLLQMPILFALFNVFRGAIELRQSAFALWIDDLSKPDQIQIGGFELHVLPLLMAVSTFFQSKMTMKDPKQAMMVYLMPVFLIWIFWSMSSGLVLYWTMFNVLTVLQQQVMEQVKKRF